MKKPPSLQIAVVCYVLYLVIVIGAMMAGGANYLDMTSEDVIFASIVLPLILGAIFLVMAINWLGWWGPVMRDPQPAQPRILLWVMLLATLSFIAIGLSSVVWSNLSSMHLLMLATGAILVGFNEEALTRGILYVGARGEQRSEAFVLLFTALFFGLLHLPNALIGLPLGGAALQVVFAGIMGVGLYVLRRTSGMLLVPMVIHGLWDFSTFSHGASGAAVPELRSLAQFTAYGLAMICGIVLALKMRGKSAVAA